MTKSKNSLVRSTTSTTYLDIVTFPVIVVESTFSLLSLGRYLLPLTTLNRYLSRHSNKNFIFTTSSKNITITKHGVFLVTIPILCFVMIHWIQWIQQKLFRKTSNRSVSIYLICSWESTHFRRKTDTRTWPLLADSIGLSQHVTTSIAAKYFHSELYGLPRNAHEYYG